MSGIPYYDGYNVSIPGPEYYRTIPADLQANPGYFISVRTKFPISPVTPILTRPPVRIGAFMPGGFMNSEASKNAGEPDISDRSDLRYASAFQLY